MPDGFTVEGKAGRADASIVWADGAFSEGSYPLVATLIEDGTEVCATPTGPCFKAAAAPGHVALLTAIDALDEVTEIRGADAFITELSQLSEIPADATP